MAKPERRMGTMQIVSGDASVVVYSVPTGVTSYASLAQNVLNAPIGERGISVLLVPGWEIWRLPALHRIESGRFHGLET